MISASTLAAVRGGQTALIEADGEPEVAVVDVVDYRILRAIARAQTHPALDANLERGLPNVPPAAADGDAQAPYDIVLAYYLAGGITLGRAAEALGLAWVDLQQRFARLDVPLSIGSHTVEDAVAEIAAAESIG
jgi:hypothetical protein